MLSFTEEQFNALLLGNRPALRRDLTLHLQQVHPELFAIHPLPYLVALVDDSIELAMGFGFTDVYAMRVFLQLRWDVAPGYYLQDEIGKGLRTCANLGMGCWRRLAADDFGDAWLDARKFDTPYHWRARLWGESPP